MGVSKGIKLNKKKKGKTSMFKCTIRNISNYTFTKCPGKMMIKARNVNGEFLYVCRGSQVYPMTFQKGSIVRLFPQRGRTLFLQIRRTR